MGGKRNPFCQCSDLFNGDHENLELQEQSLKEFRAGEKGRTVRQGADRAKTLKSFGEEGFSIRQD
jgi:hypothetical protein